MWFGVVGFGGGYLLIWLRRFKVFFWEVGELYGVVGSWYYIMYVCKSWDLYVYLLFLCMNNKWRGVGWVGIFWLGMSELEEKKKGKIRKSWGLRV